ncbi:MAG TPA: PEP-CTERM system histidine kinase PrsK, partial [Gammaproteobacteria bacterium]|nr:PEP-CTERM system histidine kinase PrsK [Gammaproteobacteria bacterium]
FFAAGMLLVVLLFSGQMRARLRVFLSKHFFNYRYDYREEWLRFIDTLSSARLDPELRGKVIEAMGQIVESPGGLLWQRDEQDDFQLTAYWNMSESRQIVHGNDPLIRFLRKRGWVIELMQVAAEPESYEGLELPAWLEELTEAWLLVPLTNLGELQGFVVLGNPRVPLQINWEVRDLLLTIGRQSASYLALQAANEALVDARQFEAFNRLSAYVVHDLKNLVAQLSLVVRNAERHRDNPAFVEDAFATVDNAVKKMNRLLSQLCQGRMSGQPRRPVEVCALLEEVVAFHARQRPRPVLESCQGPVKVLADGDRLAAVLGHLVQNAQDATPDDGNIQVRLHRQGDKATVEIEDTGCGMDETFVRERLFRPFDTTKGNAGMGIGVYESREFVQSLGGRLTVDSVPGRGTTFRLKLPLVDVADWE